MSIFFQYIPVATTTPRRSGWGGGRIGTLETAEPERTWFLQVDRSWSDGDTKRSVYQFDKPVQSSQQRLTRLISKPDTLHCTRSWLNATSRSCTGPADCSFRFSFSTFSQISRRQVHLSLSVALKDERFREKRRPGDFRAFLCHTDPRKINVLQLGFRN
jgi:hypothetical protein